MHASDPVVFTVGHSTRSFEELVEILRAHGVKRVVDVRTIPRSRHNPQFNRETLSKALHNRRLSYRHMKALGGLRHARPIRSIPEWRNASFRGFADYMQTPPLRRLWKDSSKWRSRSRPPSCVPRRFLGVAIAR